MLGLLRGRKTCVVSSQQVFRLLKSRETSEEDSVGFTAGFETTAGFSATGFSSSDAESSEEEDSAGIAGGLGARTGYLNAVFF